MYKHLSLSVLLLCITLVSTGCAGGTPESAQNQSPMRIARYYWPGQYWVDIAAHKGWFAEEGLNAELIDTNADFVASMEDVVNGTLDTQNFYLFDVVKYNLEGKPLVMVINNDRSQAEAIVARAGIQTASDLRGKRVGVTKGTALEYLLFTYLERNQIDEKDLILVDIPVEKLVDAFGKKEIDAFVAYDPFPQEAVDKFGAVELFNTSQLAGVSIAGYTFRKDYIEEHREDIQKFAKVWHRTTTYLKENPQESYAIIAQLYEKSPEEVEAFTESDVILTLKDNLTSLSYSAGFDTVHGSVRQMQSFFAERGIDTSVIDSTKLIDARFVRALEQ